MRHTIDEHLATVMWLVVVLLATWLAAVLEALGR